MSLPVFEGIIEQLFWFVKRELEGVLSDDVAKVASSHRWLGEDIIPLIVGMLLVLGPVERVIEDISSDAFVI